MKRVVCVVFSIIVLWGCGVVMQRPMSPAFDTRFVPNDKEKIAKLSKELQEKTARREGRGVLIPNALGKPLLLGTKAGKPATLMLYLIDEGRMLWSVERDISTKPSLLYDTIIIRSGNDLVGLRLDNGKEKWKYHLAGWEYFGADQEKDRIFITLGQGGECRRVGKHKSKVISLDASSGRLLWERQVEGHCLGAPSAAAGYLFLPFDMQSISVLNSENGREEARLLSLDDNFTFVTSTPRGVFYGSKGLYRFDAKSYSGLRSGNFNLTIKANDPVILTLLDSSSKEDLTVYRSKGGAPPGFEDKATPFGKWEKGQDRILQLFTDGTFKVTNMRGELTTLQSEGTMFVAGEGRYSIEGKQIRFTPVSATYYHPPLGKIPGEPELYPDRISPVVGTSSARDKIRFVWAPAAQQAVEGEIAFAGNSIFLMYYRFLLAFDAVTGKLRWAFRSRLDLEEVVAGPGGVFIVDRKGDITCLDLATGKVKGKMPTGHLVTAASFSVGEYIPNFPPIRIAEESLRESLLQMVLDKDDRLVPIKQFLLGLLAEIEEPEVTKDLLTIYMDRSVPEDVKTVTSQKILERESGAAYLIEAMRLHYDYLNEISPPPVGTIAQALVKMKAKEGVHYLLQHLLDHETPLADLKEIGRAILELGDESHVPVVGEYLVRYHADSAFKDDLTPLYVLAEVVYRHGGSAGEELLRKLQADPKTMKGLANYIKELFDRAYEKKVAAQMQEGGRPKGEGKVDEGKEIVEEGRVYATLSQAQITKLLDAVKPEMAACIQAYVAKGAKTSQVRMKFILNNQGKVENLMTLPNDPTLSSCLMGILLKVKFPKIQQLKQTAQYVITVEKPKEVEPEWPPQPTPQPEETPPPEVVQPQPQPQPPSDWFPMPQPLPLPQPPQPQPVPPQPLPEQPPEQPPTEEYPDVLPEDLLQ